MTDDKLIQTIKDILKRGNDAEVRRKGEGVIILEVERKIKYKASR